MYATFCVHCKSLITVQRKSQACPWGLVNHTRAPRRKSLNLTRQCWSLSTSYYFLKKSSPCILSIFLCQKLVFECGAHRKQENGFQSLHSSSKTKMDAELLPPGNMHASRAGIGRDGWLPRDALGILGLAFHGLIYRVVQKKCSMFENPRPKCG